ncbi:hypothetical protein GCM10010335_29170 [Streptomyces galbus]|nr:hypothetical protein GCM10010335_29170 [Streptomyces galbus]
MCGANYLAGDASLSPCESYGTEEFLMIEQRTQESSGAEGRAASVAGGMGFLGGFATGIGFFAFFPGLPHVVDWGAILVAVGVGGLVRWGVRWWVGR